MSDSILDVCYAQADISVFEIESSNISHLNAIISHLDDTIETIEQVTPKCTYKINDLKAKIILEKNHYTAVAANQFNFWGYVKDLDIKMKLLLASTFNEARYEESKDNIFNNIEKFKIEGLFVDLYSLDKEKLEILNTAFILKGLLEVGSTKDEVLMKLKELYDSGSISTDVYNDLEQFLNKSVEVVSDVYKGEVENLIKDYLKSKCISNIDFPNIFSTFKKVTKNLNDVLIDAASIKSADDILKYSKTYNKLLDSTKILSEHTKTLAFNYGVGVVTSAINIAEFWNDFQYDVNTIEMSATEAVQNVVVNLGDMAASQVGGMIATATIPAIITKVFGIAVPKVIIFIGGAMALSTFYNKYIADSLKENLREFKDSIEQYFW